MPPDARMAFNRYRHHSLGIVRNEMGEDPIIITREDGIPKDAVAVCLWCAAMVYLLVARGQGWGCCRSVVVVTGQTAVAARATSVASWEGRMVGYGT